MLSYRNIAYLVFVCILGFLYSTRLIRTDSSPEICKVLNIFSQMIDLQQNNFYAEERYVNTKVHGIIKSSIHRPNSGFRTIISLHVK